jgi:hypothetical protein
MTALIFGGRTWQYEIGAGIESIAYWLAAWCSQDRLAHTWPETGYSPTPSWQNPLVSSATQHLLISAISELRRGAKAPGRVPS